VVTKINIYILSIFLKCWISW